METAAKMTLDEAHLEFAKQANGEVWRLLEKDGRSPDDDRAMVIAAFASLYHWSIVGKPVHRQRGEWLIAHVFTVLGDGQPADLRRALHGDDRGSQRPDVRLRSGLCLRGPRQSPRSGRPS